MKIARERAPIYPQHSAAESIARVRILFLAVARVILLLINRTERSAALQARRQSIDARRIHKSSLYKGERGGHGLVEGPL